jgi:cytochrome c556
MKLTALALGAALIGTSLIGTGAMAADATDPTVIARKDLMKSFGGAAKALGGMAGGEVAYDAAAAEAAKAALVAGAADIAAKFEMQAEDPASEAKPDVWTNWEDFLAKAKMLGDAGAALDVASLDGIKAGMGAIGGSCKDCHTTYRVMK